MERTDVSCCVQVAIVAACVAAASAFSASPALPRAASRKAVSGWIVFNAQLSGMHIKLTEMHAGLRMQDQSIAMPFLSRPPRLDGTLAGDVGFDPLGFSNYFDLKWLREAELKHGRVSMLGALGFVVQEKTHLPLPGFDNKLATEAFFTVPAGGLWQIFFTLGAIEVLSNSGKITPVS
jgi:hypothetical protein